MYKGLSTQNMVDMEIIVRGKPVRKYDHQGYSYVEGRKGSTYQIRLINRSHQRLECIVSVDGLDVVHGKPAGIESTGYLLNPHQILDIPGWRVDDNTVAEFEFSSKNSSYASSMGEDVGNSGAIGVMVFEEKRMRKAPTYPIPRVPRTPPIDSSPWIDPTIPIYPNPRTPWPNPSEPWVMHTSNSQGTGIEYMYNQITASAGQVSTSASRSVDSFELGTNWGDAKTHKIENVDFDRKSDHPSQVFAVYYDSRRGLEQRGIVIKKSNKAKMPPDPFPGYTSSTGAKPPPGWKK